MNGGQGNGLPQLLMSNLSFCLSTQKELTIVVLLDLIHTLYESLSFDPSSTLFPTPNKQRRKQSWLGQKQLGRSLQCASMHDWQPTFHIKTRIVKWMEPIRKRRKVYLDLERCCACTRSPHYATCDSVCERRKERMGGGDEKGDVDWRGSPKDHKEDNMFYNRHCLFVT